MSTLRVNKITNTNNTGVVTFSQGFTVPGGKTISSNISLSGVCTATTFSGDGSGITVTGGVTNAKLFGITLIT